MSCSTERISPEDYIVVKPMDRAECVIRAKYIHELNEAWDNKPATVYFQDPDLPPDLRKQKETVHAISADEYARLRMVLTGLPPVPAMGEFQQMVKVIKDNPGLTGTEEVEVAEDPKPAAKKKRSTKK
jgi:hypothetical protein